MLSISRIYLIYYSYIVLITEAVVETLAFNSVSRTPYKNNFSLGKLKR